MVVNKHRVFLFWGAMDLMYVLGFIYLNLSHGRVPIYDDAISFRQVELSYGGVLPVVLFSSSLLLIFSTMLTMWLFFKQRPWVRIIAYLQIPFRLFLVVPSLSFTPWMINLFGINQAVAVFSVLIVSEVLKVISLYKTAPRHVAGV
jgi:hypothetical protein